MHVVTVNAALPERFGVPFVRISFREKSMKRFIF